MESHGSRVHSSASMFSSLAELVRSGNVNLPNSAGTFRNAGQWGNSWSSRGGAATYQKEQKLLDV